MTSSPQPFDPYHKWLGIRAETVPPNHYQLLGISDFEDDPDVITAAADRQMAHVRKYQQGQHADLSQTILNQLAAAKLCLLRTESKETYDAGLRSVWATESARPSGEIRLRIEQIADSLEDSRPSRQLLAAAVLVPLMIIAGVGIWWFTQSETHRDPVGPAPFVLPVSTEEEGESDDESTSTDSVLAEAIAQRPENDEVPRPDQTAVVPAADARDENQDNIEGEPPLVTVVPTKGGLPDDQNDDSVAPWDVRRDRVAFTPKAGGIHSELQQAMHNRDIERARNELKRIGAAATTPEQREVHQQLDRLLTKLEEFWGHVQRAHESLQLGDELVFVGQPVVVQEVHSSNITLRAANEAKKTFSTRPTDIDADLAVAFARHNLRKSPPTADLTVAVFLLVDRQGNLAQAQRLFAIADSQAIPVASLLATWKSPAENRAQEQPAVVVSDVEPAPQVASQPMSLPAEPTENARAIPPDEEVATARDDLRETLKNEYSRRKKDDKRRLSHKLFNDGNTSGDDRVLRYVTYDEALQLAMDTGDAAHAINIIDAMEHNFDVDSDALRLNALRVLQKSARATDDATAAFSSALRFGMKMVAADNFELAGEYAEHAERYAKVSKNEYAKEKAKAFKRRVMGLRQDQQAMTAARETLKTDPTNPAANSRIGQFYFISKRDYSHALPYLATGEDAELATLAKRELEAADSTEDQLAVADSWWEASEHVPAELAESMRLHAATQYAAVLPSVSGANQNRVIQRSLSAIPQAAPRTARLKRVVDMLTENTWQVSWLEGPAWSWAKLSADGLITATINKATIRGRYQIVEGSLRIIMTEGAAEVLVFVPLRQGLAKCSRFDLSTGELIDKGVVTLISEGVARGN